MYVKIRRHQHTRVHAHTGPVMRRCFAVFCVRAFSVFHKTAQNRPKNIQNAQNEQNTLCAIQRNTVLCVFSHSENVYKKHSQNTSKTLQNICKTPQNTAKHCFSKNTRKPPQNTHKTPAEHRKHIAKHHKTDLLTKQTELTNKPLGSRQNGQEARGRHSVRPLARRPRGASGTLEKPSPFGPSLQSWWPLLWPRP